VDVIINDLTSTVEVASEETLLDPSVLRRIVRAVAARLREEDEVRRWEERERQPRRGSRQ
jgi:hypothetical protein